MRGTKGRRKREGWTRGDERERTAPYLRNFKLNCDVFKLTFLPARPHAHSFSLSLSSSSLFLSSFHLLSPCSFYLALPPAFQLETRARPKVETCDITAGFFRSSLIPALSLSLSLAMSFFLDLSISYSYAIQRSLSSSRSARQSQARKRA